MKTKDGTKADIVLADPIPADSIPADRPSAEITTTAQPSTEVHSSKNPRPYDEDIDPPIGEMEVQPYWGPKEENCCACGHVGVDWKIVLWSNEKTIHKFFICNEGGLCESKAREKLKETKESYETRSTTITEQKLLQEKQRQLIQEKLSQPLPPPPPKGDSKKKPVLQTTKFTPAVLLQAQTELSSLRTSELAPVMKVVKELPLVKPETPIPSRWELMLLKKAAKRKYTRRQKPEIIPSVPTVPALPAPVLSEPVPVSERFGRKYIPSQRNTPPPAHLNLLIRIKGIFSSTTRLKQIAVGCQTAQGRCGSEHEVQSLYKKSLKKFFVEISGFHTVLNIVEAIGTFRNIDYSKPTEEGYLNSLRNLSEWRLKKHEMELALQFANSTHNVTQGIHPKKKGSKKDEYLLCMKSDSERKELRDWIIDCAGVLLSVLDTEAQLIYPMEIDTLV